MIIQGLVKVVKDYGYSRIVHMIHNKMQQAKFALGSMDLEQNRELLEEFVSLVGERQK